MPELHDTEAVELIRSVLSRGSYQMPLEPLPYSAQAHTVWEAIRGPLTAERDRYKKALTAIAELPFHGLGSNSWRLIAEEALDQGQTDD
jgi:hypothetical protein